MNTLKAEKRTMDTKAKRLRREGYVTGNVFGREMEGSLPVKIEKSAVEKLLKTNNKGSQIMLDVDGQSYDVLIKEIQFNPLKGQVDEIDFQALVSNEKVHSVAEIVLVTMINSQLVYYSSIWKRFPSALSHPHWLTKLWLMSAI